MTNFKEKSNFEMALGISSSGEIKQRNCSILKKFGLSYWVHSWMTQINKKGKCQDHFPNNASGLNRKS